VTLRLWSAAAVLVAVACGGRVIEQAPQGSVGAGGSPAAGSGGASVAGTGGYRNTGGTPSSRAGGAPMGGTGGAPVVRTDGGPVQICAGSPSFPVLQWLDDFEGVGNVLSPSLGWLASNDGHEVITSGGYYPITEPLSAWGSYDGRSKVGLHMAGYVAIDPAPGENIWGATWTFESKPYPGRSTVDISMHKAILLWARLAVRGRKGNLLVELPVPATVPKANGGDGSCDISSSRPCNVHYQAPVEITQTCWTQFMVPFEAMYVPVVSAPIALDLAHVFGVDLLVSAWGSALEANWPVDVIVDDLGLY
jgi:hypothetical protein